jgi:uracil phosphoribosyltransferase
MLHHFPSLHIVNHPVIQDKLSRLRDKNCPMGEFRELVRKITVLMAYEALRDLPMTTRQIETPMATFQAPVLAGPSVTIIPILRAGLGMSDALTELLPEASMGHIGVYRDHATKKAIEYLVRLPPDVGQNYVITDPMLATGGSLIHTCKVLNEHGIDNRRLRAMVLVAAPEGVKALTDVFPDIPVYGATLDDHLNENAYIIPGLGDAGDRIFGT